MRKITLLMIVSFSTLTLSASEITETQKLHTTARIWGFLKYYHPVVAKGKFNWNQQLYLILDKTESISNSAELSAIYLGWINNLGEIKTCKSCSKPVQGESFDKNFDLSWTQDNSLFSAELSAKLKFIEHNRVQGKSYYVSPGPVNNAVFENENPDGNWSNENFRLLTLFRYWNQMEYFFPYKYMTDQKWDDALLEMIPKVRTAQTEQQFHLALLELVSKLNDAHAGLVSLHTSTYFGMKWAPVGYTFIEGQPIITSYYDDQLATQNNLLKGDIIKKVEEKPIAEILKEKWKYIHGSNESGKFYNSYHAILNGMTDSVSITIDRNGTLHDIVIGRYSNDRLKPMPKSDKVWQIFDDNIGYVNLGFLEVSAVDLMMKELKNTKAIIFDVRNYPRGTLYKVASYLYPQKTNFAKLIEPDLSYPGKFRWLPSLSVGRTKKDYFKGKVLLLANERTGSHGEFTVMGLQQAPTAITIGSQTAGADGNISQATFPSGIRCYFSGLGVFYPDGSETQRLGIKIDLQVLPTIESIRAGRDEVLEKALEVAAQQ